MNKLEGNLVSENELLKRKKFGKYDHIKYVMIKQLYKSLLKSNSFKDILKENS